MKLITFVLSAFLATCLLASTASKDNEISSGPAEAEISIPIGTFTDSLQQATTKAESTPNADLFYNLGVDYFTLGDVGHANLYYLKALNLNSAHKQARANLDTSIRLGQDAKLYPQHLFLVRALFQFSDFLSVQRLAVLALIFLLLSALAFIWLLFYDSEKERALPILILSFVLLLSISSFVALGIKSYRQTHNPEAVIIAQRSDLFPAQGTSTNPVMELHAGLIVHVIEVKPDFWTVRLPNGEMGKISAKQLKKVRDGK